MVAARTTVGGVTGIVQFSEIAGGRGGTNPPMNDEESSATALTCSIQISYRHSERLLEVFLPSSAASHQLAPELFDVDLVEHDGKRVITLNGPATPLTRDTVLEAIRRWSTHDTSVVVAGLNGQLRPRAPRCRRTPMESRITFPLLSRLFVNFHGRPWTYRRKAWDSACV